MIIHHVKDLQSNARVSVPGVRFAILLHEQLGCSKTYPIEYDIFIYDASEELSHQEIVGATIQMLLTGVNDKRGCPFSNVSSRFR